MSVLHSTPPPPSRLAHVRDFLFHYQPVCSTICKNEHIPCAASFSSCMSISGTGCSWSKIKQWLSLLLYTFICSPSGPYRIRTRQYIVLGRELHLITFLRWVSVWSGVCQSHGITYQTENYFLCIEHSRDHLFRSLLPKGRLKELHTLTFWTWKRISRKQDWGLQNIPRCKTPVEWEFILWEELWK